MPVFVKMQHTNEMAVVPDGVNAQEEAGTLKVFDGNGNTVGSFKHVDQWYIGQAEPLQAIRKKK